MFEFRKKNFLKSEPKKIGAHFQNFDKFITLVYFTNKNFKTF